jgi:hypothetical protein
VGEGFVTLALHFREQSDFLSAEVQAKLVVGGGHWFQTLNW